MLLVAAPAASAVLAHLVLAIIQAHALDLPRAAVRVLAPGRRGRHVRDRTCSAAGRLLRVRRPLLLLARRIVAEEAPARHAVRLDAQLPRPVRERCGRTAQRAPPERSHEVASNQQVEVVVSVR